MPEIRGIHLSKGYRETQALNDVSFTVSSGMITALIGPSGAGKTTLLRCIAGLEKPDEGTILIGGNDMSQKKPHERQTAMIFQSAALFPATKIADKIGWGLARAGYRKDEIRAMVQETADIMHIGHLLDRLPHELSAGERQRAGIARALIRRPQILLMDEPFASLDARLSDELQNETVSLQRKTKMTMIFVTHDQDEAMNMADNIILMNHGRIAASGTPRDLYRNPPHLFAAQFIGSPAINVIEKGTSLYGLLELKQGFDPSAVTAAVRPGSIQIREDGIEGTVQSCRIQSGMYVSRIRAADQILTVMSGRQLHENETVHLRFAAEEIHLFDQQGKTV